jgi:hypothetical protein
VKHIARQASSFETLLGFGIGDGGEEVGGVMGKNCDWTSKLM